ncbi:MAG: triose-phosphate isomerase [Acidobacteriota bacterium]
MRTKLVAGNWKMNGLASEARAIAAPIAAARGKEDRVDVLVCPPFTSLGVVRECLAGSRIALGGQDVHPAPSGAFTGEISAPMLRDAGCAWVIVGHSERRQLFGETDASVRAKVEAALASDLRPIVCVGETLEEREGDRAFATVERQLSLGLQTFAAGAAERLTIAYEPVWAIGTGRTATREQAQEMHAFVRGILQRFWGEPTSRGLRILYGGSVTADNAAALLASEDVDGALIGGASLKPEAFVRIIDAACGSVRGSQ